MMIRFPDLKTLQLALTSGAVPAEVAQKPAVAGFGEDEQLWVETAARLPSAAQKELKRLGALVGKPSGAALTTEVSCWLELLPLVPDEAPLDTLEQVPVLFEVPSGEELARLALEMLRLGNDRQSYRWLEETNGKAKSAATAENGRALLRVVGPPYYSLLRALDQLGGADVAPRAFVERASGVWVEAGQQHPLAARIKPPRGHLLLLRPPRQWLLLPEAPFHDIYDSVEFQLPDGASLWQEGSLPERLKVAPRLRQAGPAEGAELWVLRGDAIDELNRFVQNVEDQLLGRLSFAVAQKEGQTLVVLRVRQSKQPPPILVLPAEAYKSHLKLPNLFLPAGTILHPPLRRDVVRKLLADDPTQITWLVLGANGQFTPESIADNVFRPLTDWVDYVLDRDRESLQAWVQAMQFDFEPFICDEDEPRKPRKPPESEKPRPSRGSPRRAGSEGDLGDKMTPEAPADANTKQGDDVLPDTFDALAEVIEPSAVEQELQAVEEEFLALPGGLEEPARQGMWPRLAQLNAQLQKTEDASLCWLNALWDGGEHADTWTAAWLRTEAVGIAQRQASSPHHEPTWIASLASPEGHRREVSANDLDRLFTLEEPTTSDLRAFAAYLAWSARREPRPAALVARLSAAQRFLEKHEKFLPVRACWLAWYHLVQLSEGDVLALARARDRILERLFHNGLRPEQDLPGFLRFAGHPARQRFRNVSGWLRQLHERVKKWIGPPPTFVGTSSVPRTGAYADLIFAFGFARLGGYDNTRELLHAAEKELAQEKEAHRLLLGSFRHRIQQVLDGESCRGSLPREITDQLEPLRKSRKQNEPDQAYVVDSLRSISRIIEPEQRLQPYRHVEARENELSRAASELPDITDRAELLSRLLSLLKNLPKGARDLDLRVRTLKLALEQAPRIGDDFAKTVLDQALSAYDNVPENADPGLLKNRGSLLEKGLLVAAHFDRPEHIHALLARFQKMLRGPSQSLLMEDLEKLIAYCFLGLRKLGLREEINQLLIQISAVLMEDREVASLDRRRMAETPEVLHSLLQVAAGWYYFGRDERTQPIMEAAREILYEHTMLPLPRTRLACTYASTLAHAPEEVAKTRLEELFERLDRLENLRAMSSFYNQLQVRIIETAVLAVVSDDFTQGAQARRWLDEDEYLVRQRIHGDVRHLLAQA